MRLAANIIPGPFGRTEAPLHDMPSKIHDMAWGEQWERHHGLVVEIKSNYVIIVAATMGVSMHGGVHAWQCPCMAVPMARKPKRRDRKGEWALSTLTSHTSSLLGRTMMAVEARCSSRRWALSECRPQLMAAQRG